MNDEFVKKSINFVFDEFIVLPPSHFEVLSLESPQDFHPVGRIVKFYFSKFPTD